MCEYGHYVYCLLQALQSIFKHTPSIFSRKGRKCYVRDPDILGSKLVGLDLVAHNPSA